eukprot:TRINITY_DN3502_c0_g1_i2.p1 TRINITY_DN3502_c0_g1~~TRINITY_DN3502_c0_g1_i2.p1  ORF type:complete len:244 (-),score=69.74 TRINITY_DN3502_c0_g1_i2:154-885(-)
MLNCIFATHPELHYVQGFHDIASVLLVVCGYDVGLAVLDRLVTTHLRAWLSVTMDPIRNILDKLYPLLQRVDPTLVASFRKMELPSFFALSWLLTWFAHTFEDLAVLSRFFDVFIASDPVMPLYMCASFVLHLRPALEKAELDQCTIHAFFTNAAQQFRLDDEGSDHPLLEGLITDSLRLYDQHPPPSLHFSKEVTRLTSEPGREPSPLPGASATYYREALYSMSFVLFAVAVLVANEVMKNA